VNHPVGHDRRVSASDVEADPDHRDFIAVRSDAADRHHVAHVSICHERHSLGTRGNVAELHERFLVVGSEDRLSQAFLLPRCPVVSNAFYGGKQRTRSIRTS
jgi:hypothetical protein